MAQAFHAKRALIYAAVETTPGTYVTDATLFTAANCLVQAQDVAFDVKPMLTERRPQGPSLQRIESVPGQVPGGLKFKHRCFTSGTAGTAPSYGPLLKAAYLSETVVASTSVTYTSNPNAQVSLSIGVGYLTEDGAAEIRWALSGVRGNVTLAAGKIGEPLMWSYDFSGAVQLAGGASTTPVSSITWTNETLNGVRFMQFAGTPTGLFAYQCDSFEFDRGAKVEMLTDDVANNGLMYAILQDDSPALKIGYRLIPKATGDEMNKYETGTTFANSLQLGSTAGKIFTISTNSSAQYAGLSLKAIGAAQGLEANVNGGRTNTGTASDAFSFAFT